MDAKQQPDPQTQGAFDSNVQITSSGIKYFLMGIIFLSVVVIVWSIFGRIPVKVNGKGVIVRDQYVSTISANYPGIVHDIYKKLGDTVHKNEKLVKLGQFELSLDIKEKLFQLNLQLKKDSVELLSLENDSRQKMNSFKLEKETLLGEIKNYKEKISYYEKLFAEKEELLEKGIVSETDLKQTEFYLQGFRLDLINAKSQLAELNYQMNNYKQGVELKRIQILDGIKALKEQISSLYAKDERYSYILADFNGVIQEVLIQIGQRVGVQQKVFTVSNLDTTSTGLRVDMFVAYNSDQRVNVGMDAVVAPLNVDKNQYGQIMAKMEYISQYPATNEFLMKVIDNQDYVELIGSRGPVYYAKAKLLTDTATVSGLKWTSRKGAPYIIHEGTVCDVDVYVAYMAPIHFVMPWFKKIMSDEQDN